MHSSRIPSFPKATQATSPLRSTGFWRADPDIWAATMRSRSIVPKGFLKQIAHRGSDPRSAGSHDEPFLVMLVTVAAFSSGRTVAELRLVRFLYGAARASARLAAAAFCAASALPHLPPSGAAPLVVIRNRANRAGWSNREQGVLAVMVENVDVAAAA